MKKVTAKRGVTDKFRAFSVKSTHMRQDLVRSMPASYKTARGHLARERPPYKTKQVYRHRDC